MQLQEALDRVLRAHGSYYTVNRDDPTPPFAAEAEFSAHGEQYFLLKSAKIADIDSNEYVFVSSDEVLTAQKLTEYDRIAWETGMARVRPAPGHRNSDVIVIALAQRIDADAAKLAKKLHHYRSYSLGLRGWSNYRLIAYELDTGTMTHNRQGHTLVKLMSDIMASQIKRT